MQVSAKKTEFSTELLLKISEIVVKKFVKNGSVKYDDYEDVKQSIIEKYLRKKDKIESSFTGNSRHDTYISAILYRMVLEILRSEKNKPEKNLNTSDNPNVFDNKKVINPEEKLIIENEKKHLKRIMLTLGKDRVKINLFIKFYFRMLIVIFDLKNYVPEKFTKKVLEILQHNENIKDKEIYTKLSEAQNIFETKKVKPDAVRMFINKNINKIINRLNGTNRAFYTKESLQILFEV